MFRGRELTEEEALEASKRQQAEPSGLQRASTLEAIKRIMAAGPQAEPAPPPEPINVPPMLERPAGAIPAALLRPSGEVVHPRDQALISGWNRFRRGGAAPRTAAAAPRPAGAEIPEMLRRLPEPRVPRTAEGMVLEKFGGDMGAYDKWWRSLPQSMKPRSWDQALGMVSSPEALGIPKAVAPKKVAPKAVAHGELEQIKADEGWRSKVYKDTEGIKTIGYGFNLERPDAAAALKSAGISKTVDDLKSGKATLTTEEGTKLIEAEIPQFEAAAQQFVGKETWGKLSPDKQQVLTNMAFNLGSTRLQGFAKLKKAVQGGDWATAQAEMKDSNWYGQVGKRADRLIERMGSPAEGADALVGPPPPEVQEAVAKNPDAFFHPLGNAPNNAVWEVSSSVGPRTHPKTGVKGKMHEGTDFRAVTGTPLLAMQGGKVTYNRTGGGAGNRIQITYDNGAVVKYFHMDKRSKLEEGVRVKPGQVVGAVGTSGNVTGAHLHAELRMKNPKTGKVEIHDLEKYLKAKGSPAAYGDTLLPPGHSKGDGHKH